MKPDTCEPDWRLQCVLHSNPLAAVRNIRTAFDKFHVSASGGKLNSLFVTGCNTIRPVWRIFAITRGSNEIQT